MTKRRSEAQEFYPLATEVRFSKVLTRRYVASGNLYRKEWQQTNGEVRHGFIMGVRSLSNGDLTYNGPDDGGTEYRGTEHFFAYLIAYDIRRKSVLVLPGDTKIGWRER